VKYSIVRTLRSIFWGRRPTDTTCRRRYKDNLQFVARHHIEAKQLIPDELVPRFVLAGSPEVIKEQINGEGTALIK
jgi:hypothetical protein